jgi:hypothetical protein
LGDANRAGVVDRAALAFPEGACPLGVYYTYPNTTSGTTAYAPFSGDGLEPLDRGNVFIDMNKNGVWDYRETVSAAWQRLGLLRAGETLTRPAYAACVQKAVGVLRQDGFFSDQIAQAYVEQAKTAELQPSPAQTEVRVFVGGAMTGPVKEAGATFARNSDNTLVYVTDTTGRCKDGWSPAEGRPGDRRRPWHGYAAKGEAGGGGEPGRSCACIDRCWREAGVPSPDLSTPRAERRKKAAGCSSQRASELVPEEMSSGFAVTHAVPYRQEQEKARSRTSASPKETAVICLV